jgi:hypothetical protein
MKNRVFICLALALVLALALTGCGKVVYLGDEVVGDGETITTIEVLDEHSGETWKITDEESIEELTALMDDVRCFRSGKTADVSDMEKDPRYILTFYPGDSENNTLYVYSEKEFVYGYHYKAIKGEVNVDRISTILHNHPKLSYLVTELVSDDCTMYIRGNSCISNEATTEDENEYSVHSVGESKNFEGNVLIEMPEDLAAEAISILDSLDLSSLEQTDGESLMCTDGEEFYAVVSDNDSAKGIWICCGTFEGSKETMVDITIKGPNPMEFYGASGDNTEAFMRLGEIYKAVYDDVSLSDVNAVVKTTVTDEETGESVEEKVLPRSITAVLLDVLENAVENGSTGKMTDENNFDMEITIKGKTYLVDRTNSSVMLANSDNTVYDASANAFELNVYTDYNAVDIDSLR